jgi:hypothetical protein
MKNLKIKIGILVLVIGLFINSINAQTLIYDNISTSNYKLLKIDDVSNIKILNEYGYEVYINNSYLGTYKKDENIFIPDNSNIIIFIPSVIKNDFSSSWELFKNMWIVILGLLFTFGAIIIFIIWIIKKSWK